MNALQVGTVLLQKYRIDRHALEGRDVSLYDATDLPRARHVCIKVFRSSDRFERDVRGPRVVDVGKSEGLPYVVVEDSACALPRRAKPPRLPERATTKRPPPLPSSTTPPPNEPSVSITVIEDLVVDDEPSTLDEAALSRMMKPRLSPLRWGAVILVALALVAGWRLRALQRADVASASAPGPGAPVALPRIAEPWPQPAAAEAVHAPRAPAAKPPATATTAKTTAKEAPGATAAPRAAAPDPLTL